MLSTAILPAFLAFPRSSNRSLSSCRAFNDPDLFRSFSIASSSYTAVGDLASLATIRMGGGPRTYPGGVSKWQWKRMQAKKSKQLLKARLCRERQLYEMRKRAELKAAISELERPWEVVECAPVLFSTSADQQIKALADRFQRPSGFDMWSERDGPRLFRSPDDLPSARFFPKGAVHSVKPYGVVPGELADGGEKGEKMMRYDDWIARGAGGMGRGRRARALPNSYPLESERSVPVEGENGDGEGIPGSYCSDTDLVVAGSRKVEYEMDGHFRRHGGNRRSHGSDSDITVDGSRIKGDDMPGNFGSRGGWDLRVSSCESDSELVDAVSRMERHKMDGSFGRRGGGGGPGSYRDSYKSHSELAVNDSSMERDELASDFGRRGGDTRNQVSSESYSELAVAGSKMQRYEMADSFDRHRDRRGRGGNRGSYRSYSKLGKEENEGEGRGGNRNAMAGGFGRRGGRGGNRNAMAGVFARRGGRGRFRHSYGSPSELAGAVNGSSMERDELASDFRRGVNDRNQDSSESYSDLAVADRRMQRHEMVSSFDRRRGRGGRGGNRGSYRLYSEVENEENKGGYGRGGNWNVMAGGFDRRGGRGRYWNSYGSHSELAGNGSSMERDELASDFGRRGGDDRNQGSSESYSELAAAGSRMKRHEMTGNFDRRRGRGGRGRYRGTNRSYSELEKEENEGSFGKRGGNRNAMAGGFDRRGDRGGLRGWGARGGNRGFYRSSSVVAVTGSRMERNEIDGEFRKRVGHGGRKPYSSVSGTAIADSRKVRREMAGGHNRDYSYGGRVSLRPTTELTLVGGE